MKSLIGVKIFQIYKMNQDDRVGLIMRYECDDINEQDTLKLFSELIKSGLCWKLQGHYGRVATQLIENEVITSKGLILV